MSFSRFSGGTETSNNTPDNPIMWPHNFVQATSCGHFIEMNNTRNGQRVRLVHGKTRNYIDMDVKKNTQIKSHKDFIVRADRNGVFEFGKDPESDLMTLTVRGDLRIYVEGDTHYEVEGDFNHRVNGDYKLTVGGNIFNETKSNYSLKSEGGEVRIKSATYKNEGTFYNSHFKTIEQKTDKFHEITQTSGTGVVQIESKGNIRTKAEGCRYDHTFGNKFTDVDGKFSEDVKGNSFDCIEGGAYEDMDATSNIGSDYNLKVASNVKVDAGGTMDINAGGTIDMDASAIYLN
jgi:hypothetical protein